MLPCIAGGTDSGPPAPDGALACGNRGRRCRTVGAGRLSRPRGNGVIWDDAPGDKYGQSLSMHQMHQMHRMYGLHTGLRTL